MQDLQRASHFTSQLEGPGEGAEQFMQGGRGEDRVIPRAPWTESWRD